MAKLTMRMTKARVTLPVMLGIANTMLERIDFVSRINELLPTKSNHENLPSGILAKAFILSTFFDLRAPLIHIGDRFRELDTEYLFGEGVRCEDLNSFAIGRMLEKLGNENCAQVFRQISGQFYAEFHLRMRRLHADTTSISFYGEFDVDETALSEEEREAALHIVRGYNKDGRPQCKQVVVGQIVNEAGIPIVNEVLDGNTSDIDWNKLAVGYAGELMRTSAEEAILVADSKLATRELIAQMNGAGIRYVTRCPASFDQKLENRTITQAHVANQWTDEFTVSGEKKASRYRIYEQSVVVCGAETRALTVSSSALAEKVEDGIAKAREVLEEFISEIERKRFACAADAEKEWERFAKDKRTRLFRCDHHAQEEISQKKAVGRPSLKDPKPVTQSVAYRLQIKIQGEEPCAAQEYRRVQSCFVLLSNASKDTLDSRGILETYKGQMVVETSFRAYKDAALASVIYLKNPVRICAMTMLLSIALLLRGLMQHLMRQGLAAYEAQHPGNPPRIGWTGKPLKSPTYTLLFESCKQNYFIKTQDQEYSLSFYDAFNENQVVGLISLMGYEMEDLLA